MSRLFQDAAEQGHYAGMTFFTRQGVYVLTPGGDIVASRKPADADSILETLQRGLAAWKGLPESERNATPLEPVATWEDHYPEGGLVLDLVARDLRHPESQPSYRSLPRFEARSASIPFPTNFDHVWFSSAEAQQWIPAELASVGSARDVPDALVHRLACLHLVDIVSGPLPKRFLTEEVDSAWIRTEVVARNADEVRLRIQGATSGNARARPRRAVANRIETQLLGYATLDRESRSFRQFDVIALAVGTEFNLANGEPATTPKWIGFELTLANRELPKTPPHFVHRYAADWLAGTSALGPPVPGD